MKAFVLLAFAMTLTTVHGFTGMIFTPKPGYKSKADPMATIKAKVLSQCWVRNYFNIYQKRNKLY